MDASESSKAEELTVDRVAYRTGMTFEVLSNESPESPANYLFSVAMHHAIAGDWAEQEVEAQMLDAIRECCAVHGIKQRLPAPLAAAEGDLRGEALRALEELEALYVKGYTPERLERELGDVAELGRAVLAKAARKEGDK